MNTCDSQELGLSHISECRKAASKQLQCEVEKDLCGTLNLATSPGASDSEPTAQPRVHITTTPTCQTSTTRLVRSSATSSREATSHEEILFLSGL